MILMLHMLEQLKIKTSCYMHCDSCQRQDAALAVAMLRMLSLLEQFTLAKRLRTLEVATVTSVAKVTNLKITMCCTSHVAHAVRHAPD